MSTDEQRTVTASAAKARPMAWPERTERNAGSLLSRLPHGWWTPTIPAEDVAHQLHPNGKPLSGDAAEHVAAHVAWEASGRQVWTLDPDAAFALCMTDPPDWWDRDLGMTEGAVGVNCVWVSLPSDFLRAPDGHGIIGLFLRDAWFRLPDQAENLPCLRLVWVTDVGAVRDMGTIGPDARDRLVSELRRYDSQHQLRAAALAWNLLAALRHTHSLAVTTVTPARSTGTTARMEAKLGKTRAPHREIRLALAPTERPLGVVQETTERKSPETGSSRTVAGHWVRGHWHRYWVAKLTEDDRPDAARQDGARVLHRVARWVRPYLSGDLTTAAARSTTTVRMVDLPEPGETKR